MPRCRSFASPAECGALEEESCEAPFIQTFPWAAIAREQSIGILPAACDARRPCADRNGADYLTLVRPDGKPHCTLNLEKPRSECKSDKIADFHAKACAARAIGVGREES